MGYYGRHCWDFHFLFSASCCFLSASQITIIFYFVLFLRIALLISFLHVSIVPKGRTNNNYLAFSLAFKPIHIFRPIFLKLGDFEGKFHKQETKALSQRLFCLYRWLYRDLTFTPPLLKSYTVPSLQVLREAKEQSAKEAAERKSQEVLEKANFHDQFDRYQGLAHLEALEILSRESETKVRSTLRELCQIWLLWVAV